MVQRVNSLPLWLAFFTACGSAGAPAGDVVPPYGDGPPPSGAVPIASLARGPACSFYPCFEACGHNIAIATVEPAFGFSEAESVPWRWLRGAVVTSGRVLGLDQQRVELRDAVDLRLLGSSPLAGRMAIALGDRVWMQTHGAALAVIDTVTDTPTVTAWWFDAGPVAGARVVPGNWSRADRPWLELLGAVRDRLLVRTASGFSAIEPDVAGPREAFCIETPASSIWTQSALRGDVLAIAEMSTEGEPLVAHLLRVSADEASEIGSLPIGAEVPLGGQGDRLTLTSDNRRRITSYDVSGPTPVELAVADGLPTDTDDAPLGGFELRGFGRRRVAIDLRGRLERYDVSPLDDAPCLWRLEPRAGGAAYLVSPLWPDERRPAEPVPAVTCPERRSEYYADAMALSPDERSVLFGDGHFNLWIVRDLASGEEQAEAMLPAPGALLPGGDAHWIGDRVVISSTVHGPGRRVALLEDEALADGGRG
jgi:hypothetical protein